MLSVIWEATSSQLLYFESCGYLYKMFSVFMLGLAMDFNACLMGFKIIVNALGFAMVLA